jgi:hypothetical protein
MPWAALPFSQAYTRSYLKSAFSVWGIPSLIIIDAATGRVVDSNGRGTVANALRGEGGGSQALARWGLNQPKGSGSGEAGEGRDDVQYAIGTNTKRGATYSAYVFMGLVAFCVFSTVYWKLLY